MSTKKEIELIWDMSCLHRENKNFNSKENTSENDIFIFKEKIDSSIWKTNDYYGWGAYFANFSWVYCITNNITIDDDNQHDDEWKEVCNFINVDYEKNKNSKLTIACEAIKKLSCAIYYYSFYCISRKETKKAEEIYQIITRVYNRYNPKSEKYQEFEKDEKTDVCLEYLKYGAFKIENLLHNICYNTENTSIIFEIRNTIQEFIQNENPDEKSKLLPKYISNDIDDKKCVAVYVFDKKHIGKKGYIAFSGFNDCEDLNILNQLDIKNPNNIFIKKMVDISEILEYALVIVNQDVTLYTVNYPDSNKIVPKVKISNLIGNSKIDKPQFSCCERKIFTAFDDKSPFVHFPVYYNGKHPSGYHVGNLYISKEPCPKCVLAIQYEQNQGHNFKVFPQIIS